MESDGCDIPLTAAALQKLRSSQIARKYFTVFTFMPRWSRQSSDETHVNIFPNPWTPFTLCNSGCFLRRDCPSCSHRCPLQLLGGGAVAV